MDPCADRCPEPKCQIGDRLGHGDPHHRREICCQTGGIGDDVDRPEQCRCDRSHADPPVGTDAGAAIAGELAGRHPDLPGKCLASRVRSCCRSAGSRGRARLGGRRADGPIRATSPSRCRPSDAVRRRLAMPPPSLPAMPGPGCPQSDRASRATSVPATIAKNVPSVSSPMAAVARFAPSNFANGACIDPEQSMMITSSDPAPDRLGPRAHHRRSSRWRRQCLCLRRGRSSDRPRRKSPAVGELMLSPYLSVGSARPRP